ncbi:MarR family transcriptional regulator [Hyphococcus flavus]|uniref:MarR family transcriptional regulator n=1 Tax=Hyphococcus flavus TaxID=1866326 RepID=A0AAE9ZAY2_9PROT|nr:MarR family transcriptional regulator [Hyphococcus flavus]WDI30541.1 MarR family transcriptional regulator [Hyphococcus flavus]
MSERLDVALISLRQILRATEISSRALAKACGLTPSQLIMLQVLEKEGGAATPSLIAKELSLSQATVTSLIDKLEHRQIVRRNKDEQDKRRVLVELTDQGQATLANAPSILQQRFERGFEKLENWEQSFLVAALERTAMLLEAEDIDAAPVLDVGGINTVSDE